ncbi:hypothetical protein SAMN04488137_3909 [Fictibacillus solisalsi]|uniref:Uncharacterized protein n=1 Tax=Fictibacillus solisalsi TaxID=459525 RepID=A0A1H0A456_9BACL|nr:hypothetical protein [Fictibacillus solisalsi]SDN28225.1 hypothetical protein SAMN04488137_3909 [Fictibacillus solisalsi]
MLLPVGAVILALLFGVFDYWIFHDESKRYSFYKKLTKKQKVLIAVVAVVVLASVDYFWLF